jgi:hypothetical protein
MKRPSARRGVFARGDFLFGLERDHVKIFNTGGHAVTQRRSGGRLVSTCA